MLGGRGDPSRGRVCWQPRAILMRSGVGPSHHLLQAGHQRPSPAWAVGDRLQDHPFFYNVYAPKRAVRAMNLAAGAIVWTRGRRVRMLDDLDLHISGNAFHRSRWRARPAAAPCSPAAVTLPNSIGRLRLSSRDPHAAPHIRYNFFVDPNDLDRLVEVVGLSRKIGRTAPFSDLIDHEMATGEYSG